MGIQLIASDIDGTFLNDQQDFDHQRFQAQLDKLNERKIKFVVASGNQMAHCQEVFAGIKGDLTFVAEDGALTIEQGKILDDNPLKPALLHDTIEYLLTTPMFKGVELILSSQHRAFTNMKMDNPEWPVSSYFYSQLTPVDHFKDIKDPIYKIDAHWIDIDNVREQAALLKTALGDSLGSVMSGFNGIDITMPHVTKAYGLQQLQNRWKVSMDETMAFGDTQNDEAMLHHARLGYAMKNAEQEALDATELVTPLDNNDSGVMDMIDRVLRGEIE
ncbi:Cof-type HAD-IIB family hydrolase [Pediococcus pentosaceus]|uniref:Cof-type HAD-IIB family hydrolase n=1 Tax=Pediococcus pentosaceus TaxID=1255 RepID=UPI000B4B612B|nr:Cof-type HAD-IIB family hydrolase [Pediococcus pentosaceus]ASC07672.1 Sugar-phosphatase [Pediococcus pentosaceus]WFC00274.1 Cof-type HAD-IIB family hydrolase [Pediococcus pentosaceus]